MKQLSFFIRKYTVQDILQSLVFIAVLAVVNFASSSFFFRIDLTTDKKYTLKPVTREILSTLDDKVYVEVYLEGDLPAGLIRLQRAVREILNEFRAYAGKNLEYNFVNPSAEKDEQQRQRYYSDLVRRGISPVNIQDRDAEGAVLQKVLFPGAVIRYRDYEIPVNFLRNNKNLTPDENINSSVETLEYEFMVSLHHLLRTDTPAVAFIEGHGELGEYETGDISRELSRFFRIDRGTITGPGCLDRYQAVIIAAPLKPFPEKDKYVIDQYIMQGGKVLWFIDPVTVNTDSLASGYSMALSNDLNLSDQLFRYGIRLNPVLLKDVRCNVIPVATGAPGSNSQFAPVPWYYYPLLVPPSSNPVTKSVDLVKAEFAGTIDTLKNPDLDYQVILASSGYSALVSAPAMVSLSEVEQKADPVVFNKKNQLVSVIVQGRFSSVFTNRMIESYNKGSASPFRERSVPTSMFIAADGDLIRNLVKYTARGPMISPLGYDRYTHQTFGNKELILNVVHYLTGHPEISRLRGKSLRLRLLDKKKVKDEALFWKLFNTLFPLLLVVFAGFIFSVVRRRKYIQRK